MSCEDPREPVQGDGFVMSAVPGPGHGVRVRAAPLGRVTLPAGLGCGHAHAARVVQLETTVCDCITPAELLTIADSIEAAAESLRRQARGAIAESN